MYKENPRTIEELAYYLRYWIQRAGPEMPATDPNHIIGRFVRVCILDDDHEGEWEKGPQVGAIGSLASDIEINNGDIDELWQELKSRVDILEAFVGRRFLYEYDRDKIVGFTSPREVADYWYEFSESSNNSLAKHMINVVGNKHFQEWCYKDPQLSATFDLLCDGVLLNGVDWQEAKQRIAIFYSFSHKDFLYGYDQEKITAISSLVGLIDFWHKLCPSEIDFANPNLAKHTMELAKHMINVVGNKHFQEWYYKNQQLAAAFLRLSYVATGWDSPGNWREIRPIICSLKGEPDDSGCGEVVYRNVHR